MRRAARNLKLTLPILLTSENKSENNFGKGIEICPRLCYNDMVKMIKSGKGGSGYGKACEEEKAADV